MDERTKRRTATAAAAPAPAAERGGRLARGQEVPPGRRSAPPPPPDRYRYSIAELEEQTGVVARTIRFYITQGLLPPAHGRGPSATYDLSHLLRLRAIQLLKEDGRSLDDIKRRLGELSDGEIAALLEVETEPKQERWQRIVLHPDIELHVRERSGRERDARLEDAVDLIVGLARPVVDRLGRP